MNPDLDKLQPYPFQRLTDLLARVQANDQYSAIALSIGEPKHAAPEFAYRALADAMGGYERYPTTKGELPLRTAIARWLEHRFALRSGGVNPDRHVIPVNGTREALFAIAQAIVDRSRPAMVMLPNPFYQIYEGAAFLSGSEPHYMNCTDENGFIPDLDAVAESLWSRCQLLYLCSPNNPTGTALSEAYFQKAMTLSQKYGFAVASDECYSEIYFDEASSPPGLLGAATRMGNTNFENCLVFHSLSKRSNLPGLRSGFVAGDARLIAKFASYRTYHGCSMSLPVQTASTLVWQDEAHVRENRALYVEKFSRVLAILAPHLELALPDGGFCLWSKTPQDDEQFCRRLYQHTNIKALPGSYLSRESGGLNPGRGRVRMALVAPVAECVEAAERIAEFMQRNY